MKKREAYAGIKKLVKDYPEYVAFLDEELEKLDARGAKAKEKRVEAAEEKRNHIYELVQNILAEAGRPITLAELAGGTNGEYTPNTVAHYVGELVAADIVVKDKAKFDGRVLTTYRLA